jgi:hypothetical protein
MKASVQAILLGAFGAAALTLSCYATSSAKFLDEIQLNSEKVQVVHGATPNSDTTTMTLDITNNGDPLCDADGDDDLIRGGLEIALSGCACEDFTWICTVPFYDSIPNGGFVSHTINHHQYGTFFSSTEPGGAGSTTLSAKATTLSTPKWTCGRWTLNLTATKLDLSSITQSSALDPIALILNDGDDSGPICFDIRDAVVGPVILH